MFDFKWYWWTNFFGLKDGLEVNSSRSQILWLLQKWPGFSTGRFYLYKFILHVRKYDLNDIWKVLSLAFIYVMEGCPSTWTRTHKLESLTTVPKISLNPSFGSCYEIVLGWAHSERTVLNKSIMIRLWYKEKSDIEIIIYDGCGNLNGKIIFADFN